MLLIFGWGQGEVLDLGEVVSIVCPNCHNQEFAAAKRRVLEE